MPQGQAPQLAVMYNYLSADTFWMVVKEYYSGFIGCQICGTALMNKNSNVEIKGGSNEDYI
jgi:hypothetical protein